MKLCIKTDELRSLVSIVTMALAQKSESNYLRAYEFIHFSTTANEVMLKCSNGSMQIVTRGYAITEETGSALIPGKLFSDIVRMLPNDETEIDGDETSIRIRSGNVDMDLRTIPEHEFIMTEVSAADGELFVKGDVLKSMVTRTTPFALQDSSRPILGGVLFEICGHDFSVTALDGLRLAKRSDKLRNRYDIGAEFVLPSKLLDSAAKVFYDSEHEIVMLVSSNAVLFNMDSTTVTIRMMDGEFVKYKNMLPKAYDNEVRVDRNALYDAVERVYMVARDDRFNLIKLNFTNNCVTISVNNDVGRVKDEVALSMSGNPLEIAFNAKYLLEILKNIDDDEIRMLMTQKLGPCVITPVEGEKYYYLLLPVRLNG